jgi:hypothetical protein
MINAIVNKGAAAVGMEAATWQEGCQYLGCW